MMPERQVDAGALSPVKLALLELQTLRARIHELEQAKTQPIAIVGIGLRFPGGATDPESFWHLLRDGVDAIVDTPRDRWDVDAYYDPDPDAPGKMYSRGGGYLSGIDQFDPTFFGISPREANSMDPRQRLLLEVSWEALEHAGLSPDTLRGSATGVYIGIAGSHEYLNQLSSDADDLDPDTYTYSTTGSNIAVAAGRLAYVLGLQGPAMAIDTACSSSLLAVHLACQSLRAGECTTALAGGVNLILAPYANVMLSKTRAISPTDRCRAFDAAADGYVRGEGCAMVVLKRLSDAWADGDTIIAVIRGSAANQDGRSNGLTAPNGPAQESVMRKALADAQLSPSQVQFIETHGTGTSLGDPIEVQALAAVYGEGRPADRPLAIASVKTNLGHLESAAGIAGLVKAALALQRREIPPSLHFHDPNPHIAWEDMPIVVPTKRTPWPADAQPPIAGVSSFGFSGTNVHILLEAASQPEPRPTEGERPHHLLTLSAKSRAALGELADRYARFLTEHEPLLPDVCYAANTGRAHLNHRLALVAGSSAEASAQLAAFAAGDTVPGVAAHERSGAEQPEVVFLFTGQGAQYAGMGHRLYESHPLFRRVLQECDELLRPNMDQPLLSLLYASDEAHAGLLTQTVYTQPALFALEYALAQVWQSWGIEPAAVMGHSIGEYVAACVAGVFSLEEGLKLVAARARLMQALPDNGVMAAVFADEADVAPLLAPYPGALSIAALNGPANTVISGERSALQAALGQFQTRGIRTQRLEVSHAFHSPLMDPILDEFEAVAAGIHHAEAKIPLLSNLTGDLLPDAQALDAAYWRRHLREAVRFGPGIHRLHEQGFRLFLEVGPSPTLLGMARRCLPEDVDAHWLPSLRKGHDDWQQILGTLAVLYSEGMQVDWRSLDRPYARRRIPLPTYPFQRQRYWLSAPRRKPHQSLAGQLEHPLLGRRLQTAATETIFETRLETDAPAFLADHRVFDTVVVPATAYVELGLAAARSTIGLKPVRLQGIDIYQALLIPEHEPRTLQTLIAPETDGVTPFRILSLQPGKDSDASWLLHATGRLCEEHDGPAASESLETLRARCSQEVSGGLDYAYLSRAGVDFGPAFQGVRQLWLSERAGEALGRVQFSADAAAEEEGYRFHPALLDACLQAAFALHTAADPTATPDVYLPVSLERLSVYRHPDSSLWSHVQVRTVEAAPPHAGAAGSADEVLVGDFRIFDDAGQVVADLTGLHIKRANPEALHRIHHVEAKNMLDEWLYEVAWRSVPHPAASPERADTPGAWLILADRQGMGAALAQRLRDLEETAILVTPGDVSTPVCDADGIWTVDPAQCTHFEQLIAAALPPAAPTWRGVVHLWSLDSQMTVTAEAEQIAEFQAVTCGSVLHLLQALGESGSSRLSVLGLVTQGAQPAKEGADLDVAQAPLWGLGQTLALEYPDLTCLQIDIDPMSDDDPSHRLLAELWNPDGETQVALRDGRRYVARLIRRAMPEQSATAPHPATQESEPLRLDTSLRGSLDSLLLQPAARRQPGPGEVELRVRATGLNFRDVLKALGLYPGEPGPFGDECAGEVVAVGPGVERFKPGNRVFGLAADAFATYVTANADFLMAIPDAMTFEDAATVPIVFLTAHYALHHLAKIAPGERVLIHAAAGGVGMAAVQLAQRAGAIVFGTAGSAEKRAYLHAIGVDYMMDSRSLDYADEIMALTQGEGIDVVLNSLNGEFIPKNLSILKDDGRYLELGKIGIWDARQVAAVKPHVAYFPIFLGEQVEQEPALVQSMLQTLVDELGTGEIKPLPRHLFPIQEVGQAFRFMAQAKHIGKVVVTQPDSPGTWQPAQGEPLRIRPDATYLLTGGLGGVGLVVAQWLAERGARHLVLMGRSGAASDTARHALSRLEEMGVTVVVAQADVSDQADVARTLANIAQAMPPLRGLIHAAGVVEDGMLQQQTWAAFARVMAPKLRGAWHLHRLTQECPLDFFVLFSSGAALLGSPGQSNYAAANAFLDGLAHHRRSQGLPALSINWGPWATVGMAAALDKQHQQRWANRGLGSITPEQGTDFLDRAMQLPAAQIAVLPIHWSAYLRSADVQGPPPFLSEIAEAVHSPRPAQAALSPQVSFQQALAEASPEKRQAVTLSYVRDQARAVLAISPSLAIGDHQPLGELGLDSLMAIELRTRLRMNMGVSLSVADLLQGHSLSQIAATVLTQLDTLHPTERTDEAATAPAADQEWEVLTL